MNPERLIAGVSALLMLLAFVWFLTSDPQVANPGVPTYNGKVLVGLQAEVPVVGSFAIFNVNDENPFVPDHLRIRERQAREPRPPTPTPPPSVAHMHPVRPPAVPVEPPAQVITLPRLAPTAASAPQCVGLIYSEGEQMVVVRMPGVEGTVTWAPGVTVLGWTLVSIDNGNQATFTDPDGKVMVFPIGDGDLALAQTLVNPGVDAPPTKSKPGEGALLKPMLTFPTKPKDGKTPASGDANNGNTNGPRKPRRPGAGAGVVPGGPQPAPDQPTE
jgi:hypothetical protein